MITMRVKYVVEYQQECWDRYRPKCRARRAAGGSVLVLTQVWLPDPSTSLEVRLVFIIPSSLN